MPRGRKYWKYRNYNNKIVNSRFYLPVCYNKMAAGFAGKRRTIRTQ